MSNDMLRNMIELSSRPGGYTMEDLYAIFPNTPETERDLAELTNAGLVAPRYDGSELKYYEILAEGLR